MTAWHADDMSVIIPTLGRWEILQRTLDGLAAQSVGGFDVVVVVDGKAEAPATLHLPVDGRLVAQRAAGPGAARNRGAQQTRRRLLLFLGDDMVPERGLVEAHLSAHNRHLEPEDGVLGRVAWHPEVAANPLNRWLESSGTQFDYAGIERERALAGGAEYDAGFGRFYSCNVSLKRSLFEAVEGFDESFLFYYEDLDLGWRLHDKGLRLWYQPEALAHHLHPYDWASMEARFRGVALGEKLMARSRPEFEPFFHRRVTASGRAGPMGLVTRQMEALTGAVAGRAAMRLRSRRPALATTLEARADAAYHRRLAGPFLTAWEGADQLCELREYLGASFTPDHLMHHVEELDKEAARAGSETTFYQTSQAYLYDLTVFAMSATKEPYLEALRRVLPPGSRVLDYGCGIGSDGLRLAAEGYEVSFADFDNPSTRYLRWRLERRGLHADIYDISTDEIPAGFDAVLCFDVIEHVADAEALLERLEGLARVVIVNFLEPDPADTHLHRPLPIGALVDRAQRHGLVHYRVHHGRSHLVVYGTGTPPRPLFSRVARWQGRLRYAGTRAVGAARQRVSSSRLAQRT